MTTSNLICFVMFGVLFINLQIVTAIDLARFYDAHQVQKRKGESIWEFTSGKTQEWMQRERAKPWLDSNSLTIYLEFYRFFSSFILYFVLYCSLTTAFIGFQKHYTFLLIETNCRITNNFIVPLKVKWSQNDHYEMTHNIMFNVVG